MEDETFVVTGANRGIGLELCRQLIAARARVVATARDPAVAVALADLGPARVEALDIADPASVGAFSRALGQMAVDVLINNAGVGGGGSMLEDLDPAEVARFFDVNSLGPLRVTQALLPHLRRGRRRTVAQVSSRMGSLANHAGGYYGYRASKTALNSLNRTLAHELGREGFVCVALHPGWVRTDMGGAGAQLSVEESVRGLLRVIAGLTAEDNGGFLDCTGATLPW